MQHASSCSDTNLYIHCLHLFCICTRVHCIDTDKIRKTNTCIHAYTRIYTYIHVYIYIYIYTCVYIYICMAWHLDMT